MTNKPMLSVERELLERITRPQLKRRDETVRRRAITELRALLDKPDECRCKRYGKDNPHWPCPVHAEPAAQHQGEPVAWSCDKPSTPGAYWIRGFNLSGNIDQSALVHVMLDEDEQVLMVNLHQSATETDTGYWYEVGDINQEFEWSGPLYAEQLAPVAVVMPEILHQTIRDTLRNYRMSTLDDGHGGGYPLIDAMTADGQPVSGGIEECQYLADAILNACIDEVSRLNGVKP